ncbi:hypothetical protein [Acanthopleuribacter pedis]|uniref:Lipoprotein n=1 Tax=Acanthopleuribacter pedis TaxID=442870 RepID=A0A8J7Q2W0_9BACT|nr:hypothetical protein [Acanthopleuribacter pedis]MBO1317142.1 hypothetical protein [Acanthopleuribacter pedis]
MQYVKSLLCGGLLLGGCLFGQSWYLQEASKVNYKIEADISGIDFSKSKRDEFRTGTWLQNSAVSDLKLRLRDQFRRRVPFEFDPEKADISFNVVVTCDLVEKGVGLKYDNLTVSLQVDFTNPLFRTFKAQEEARRVAALNEVSNGEGATLDQFKFMIVSQAQKLITKVNHFALAASKDKITVPGLAYSETYQPGQIGTSELYLGNDQLLIYLNGKKILDHENTEVLLEPLKVPLLGPSPLVKLKSGAAPTFYFKFIDQVDMEEARKRCDLIRTFIKTR